jgi:hypothetical protein
MKNQIIDLKDLVGKTIVTTKQRYGELWLKFADNTFAVLEVNEITEGFGYTRREINLDQFRKNKTEYPLVEFGLVTEAEYNAACQQEELEFKKRQAEREDEEMARISRRELELLEQLKMKYNQ